MDIQHDSLPLSSDMFPKCSFDFYELCMNWWRFHSGLFHLVLTHCGLHVSAQNLLVTWAGEEEEQSVTAEEEQCLHRHVHFLMKWGQNVTKHGWELQTLALILLFWYQFQIGIDTIGVWIDPLIPGWNVLEKECCPKNLFDCFGR